MDYPKSVPGVGLVGGKFVDEDQVNGTPGSLIPAAWGNAVTDELLGVLAEAGVAPNEANNGQLRASILAIALNVVRSVAAKATEVVRGALRIGTQAEVDAGALDDVAVTPKKLRWGFSMVGTASVGAVRFPDWLGKIQIALGGTSGVNGESVTFALGFASPPRVANINVYGSSSPGTTYATGYTSLTSTGFLAVSNGVSFSFVAIGFGV